MKIKRRGNHDGTISQLPSGSFRAQISINGVRESYTNKDRKAVQTWLSEKQQDVARGYDPNLGNTNPGRVLGVVVSYRCSDIEAKDRQPVPE